MGKTLKEKLEELSPERRKKIEEESQRLIAEEMTRQQLRQARKLTQKQMAELLEVDQGNISRLEQRTDLMLSTLQKYIAAMGGNLKLVVEFPNLPPVTLVGISEIEESELDDVEFGS
ncbi:helix-turn-helix domain-containing protein [Mastigocoleus testarum]|uniref:Transcriptional regulator n=1 Tax=Mastigocoleus testarum BC008 TaxID=371196 RepID=A0A0V7ZH25_9CYAN|nr:helix-turn-helix domain-containing protein [Mastigocoleus testarum]KST63859.1 transcriptional regulator [Mastigocoleus testarum BC008]KST64194.1 transcriptional regulator [Mastigocoleus testarum BC008]